MGREAGPDLDQPPSDKIDANDKNTGPGFALIGLPPPDTTDKTDKTPRLALVDGRAPAWRARTVRKRLPHVLGEARPATLLDDVDLVL